MKKLVIDITKKVLAYSFSERIQRLIKLSVKQEMDPLGLTVDEMFEMSAIQAIRMENGEIDKILKTRMEDEQ